MKYKKILILRSNPSKIDSIISEAFKKKGFEVDFLNIMYFNPSADKDREYDFIIFWGGLGKKYGITKEFNKHGVNALVLENPYSMQKDHFRITVNNPVGVIEKAGKKKRNFYKLNKQSKKGDYVLLIGQNDSARDILLSKIEELKKLNLPIKFKQHPRFPVVLPKEIEEIKGDTNELIKNSYCVVTHSSNCGNIALSEGVDVICLDQKASFYNLSYDISEIDKLKKAKKNKNTEKELNDYFEKLSYCDWSIDEIKNLEFMKHYQEWLGVDYE